MQKKIMNKEGTCGLELVSEVTVPCSHCYMYSNCIKCSKDHKKWKELLLLLLPKREVKMWFKFWSFILVLCHILTEGDRDFSVVGGQILKLAVPSKICNYSFSYQHIFLLSFLLSDISDYGLWQTSCQVMLVVCYMRTTATFQLLLKTRNRWDYSSPFLPITWRYRIAQILGVCIYIFS